MYEESKEDKIIKLNVDSQIQQCNTVVNTYLEYKEVCIYKKPFTVRKGEQPLLRYRSCILRRRGRRER